MGPHLFTHACAVHFQLNELCVQIRLHVLDISDGTWADFVGYTVAGINLYGIICNHKGWLC